MRTNHKHFFAVTSITAFLIFSSVSVYAQTPPSSNPPVISGLMVDNITQSSAVVSWNTDVPATTRLDYGATANYEINPVVDPSLRTFHQIQLTQLDTNTIYHYRARSTDASGRERVEIDRTFTTPSLPDLWPPGEIASLQVASATVTSLVLTWIAPGDNGSVGTSSSYEIRTSRTTIPEIGALQWWNNAEVLDHTLIPGGSGSKESYIAKNLATSTKYYFAVRARDKGGNVSPLSISDIRAGTTLARPIMVDAPTTTVATSTPVGAGTPAPPSGQAAGDPTTSVTTMPPSPMAPTPLGSPQTAPAVLFTNNLFYGMRNESVKTLQRILIADGFLAAGNDTGFFGLHTLAAVKKFQCSQKIICSGSAQTTGYGFVGPKTRAKLGN